MKAAWSQNCLVPAIYNDKDWKTGQQQQQDAKYDDGYDFDVDVDVDVDGDSDGDGDGDGFGDGDDGDEGDGADGNDYKAFLWRCHLVLLASPAGALTLYGSSNRLRGLIERSTHTNWEVFYHQYLSIFLLKQFVIVGNLFNKLGIFDEIILVKSHKSGSSLRALFGPLREAWLIISPLDHPNHHSRQVFLFSL